ncbi:MAG: hypothetical protein FWD49_03855 [Firmicutes bacterium]|nr:hypothetical protein [Bacillota bacterium]
MNLTQKLEKIYGAGEPIFLEEIRAAMDGYSSPYVFQCIRKEIAEGRLARFDESVYYIPQDGFFGKSSLNPSKVVERKYLSDNGKIIGFYSGIGLLNAIGGTRQMAFVYEIITNNESTRRREVQVGKSRYILRKARCAVNNENKVILQVLELCNNYLWDDEAAEAVLNYAKRNNVTMRDVLRYSQYYPAKAIRNASEVLYGIA